MCVTGMGDVSKGQIREGLGTALFNVHYSCLVLRPHKGEVMDCVVTSVSKVMPRTYPAQSCSIACHAGKFHCPTGQEGLPDMTSQIRPTPLHSLHRLAVLCRSWIAVSLHTQHQVATVLT